MEQTRQAAGEKAVLAGLDAACFTKEETASEVSLTELQALLETAGGECVGKVLQSRPTPDPHSFVGQGKAEEIRDLVKETGAKLVIFDNDLTPSQIKALEGLTGASVLDRSALILDIFAQRAKTREGKLQVELAQLKYRLSRLTGLGRSMSRLGGGIGTRGPGEKKLEMDRRLIKDRIAQLNRELKEVRKHREITRAQREKKQIPVAAIVGYTNAGKSTLLNHLTGAGVLEEDKLFATLDPTTRVLELPGRQEILLTDTVGFIRKLPHHLIEAFKSTLEEAKYADMILHVVDASNPQMDGHMQVVYDTLRQLGVSDKKVITLFNKQDLCTDKEQLRDFQADHVLQISAKNGQGLEELKELLADVLREGQIYIERLVPYDQAGSIARIRKYGQVVQEEFLAEGISVKAYVPMEVYSQI